MFGCTQKSPDQFVYAVSGEFRPFSYVGEAGDLKGFDVEVGKLIAKALGKKSLALKYKFSGIIEGLKSGRFNAAVASHTVTKEREEHVSFTTPYYYSGAQVFSRQKIGEVRPKDKEIAVSKGSTYQKMAKQYSENVKVYDSDVTALEALSRGRHDIVITDFVTGAMAIKKGLKVFANQKLNSSRQAIAVAKDNLQLLKKMNAILAQLRSEGKLKELSEKYFGTDITIERTTP